jgi:hypothetical protein
MSIFCNPKDLETEGDVELKLLASPLLASEGLSYFKEDVKIKSYMAPKTSECHALPTRPSAAHGETSTSVK